MLDDISFWKGFPMRRILCGILILLCTSVAHGAVTLAVSEGSGAPVHDRARQFAGQAGNRLGVPVEVVVLADAAEVEAWLNRYATAELAVVENAFVAGRPGRFVTIGPLGDGLTVIGRQGIAGDLPQRLAGLLDGSAGPVPSPPPRVVPPPATPPAAPVRTGAEAGTIPRLGASASKSANEDRYYVTYVYREKFGRDPEPERLEYWTRQLRSGVISKQQFFEQLCRDGMALCAPGQ